MKAYNCPSCGAQVTLDSQQTVCPYCGGMLQSDFYDWQTEAFEIYEQMGTNLRNALLLLASAGILFVCVFFCLWLIRNTMVSLAAGVGVAVLVTVAILAIAVYRTMRQEKMVGQIVRYSENYLRSCIIEVLDRKAYSSDLMDYSVDSFEEGGQYGRNHHNNGQSIHQRNLSSRKEKTIYQEIQKDAYPAKGAVSETKKRGRQIFRRKGVPLLWRQLYTGRKPLLFLLRLRFAGREF